MPLNDVVNPQDTLIHQPAKPFDDESASPARPGAVLVEGSGPALTDETNSLLRNRLRLASLLLSAGFLAFLIDRVVALDELTTPLHWLVFGSHVVVTTLTAIVGWRLCRNCPYAEKNPGSPSCLCLGDQGRSSRS